MGKKAKKAAATRAAKAKADHRLDEKSSRLEKPEATECKGSKQPDLYRQRRVEGSEFFRVASLFGIAGDNPIQSEFKHPLLSCQKDPAEISNVIYNAMWAAIPPEFDLYTKYKRAFAAGRAPFEMSWEHACKNMMLGALSRLRHRRKQRKYRNKKMANEQDNQTKMK